MKIFSKGKSEGSGDGVGKPLPPAPPAPRKVERRPPARPEGGQPVRSDRDAARGEACALVDWFSVGSVKEIDGLIAALQTLCEELYIERRRVQRELSDFARVSDAAMKTTTTIVETLGQWRGAANRGG
jgi:hypothetical protein